MIEQGYSASSIGLIVSATQLPLFLLEFKTVDFIKPWGFRNIFLYCFAAMTALMILAVATANLVLIIAGYILLSLALSFLEPISDIYLFDQVSAKEEEQAFPVYSTAGFASSLVGRVGGGVTIGLFGAYAGFGFIAVILVLITLAAYRLPS